ncbi:hypothetical protein [Maribacter sp. 2308TA10-17]|uniref:hypothetical protein n=1 Tax=Maribacter sp. 2308TA10-17 TaxID=3386276 RepID=UPI0039BD8E76
MKKIVFSIALFASINMFCQEFSQELTQVIPPSPTASSLGKYGEVPVSYNIGSPSINIPLYNANGHGIQVPISLSYHASGIRVEDNASWVGMGWSLNAGGVITRSVKGAPDDSQIGLRNNTLPTDAQINDPSQTDNIGQYFGPQTSPDGIGVKDREPDLFYYNFMGASGKLYFDENNVVVTKPYNSIKVEPIFYGGEIDRWVITDQGGMQYYFGSDSSPATLGKERTSTGNEPTFTSAWYLTRVFNPKTNGNIYFEYDDNTAKTEKPKNQSLEWYYFQELFTNPQFGFLNSLQTNPSFESPSSAKTTVSGNRVLKRILCPNGTIEFTTTSNRADIEDELELSKIEIFENGTNLIKSFQFNYDFIGKLYLEGIDEYDNLTQESKPHIFEYEPKIPNGASNDQDFWGFYNAAGNSNLIPIIYSVNNPYGQYQANRLPDETAMKRGTIKKITYPTKGSTEFYFEAHRAFTPQYDDPYSPFLLNSKTDVSLTSTQGEYKEALFSIETSENQNILFDIDFTFFRDEYNTNRPAAYLHRFENGSWVEVRSWWPDYPSIADQSFNTSLELTPGDYRFILTDMPCADPLNECYVAEPEELEKIFVTYANFSYLNNSDTDLINTEITAGGLRIKNIINKDSDGSIINHKRFTYEQGKLITFPVHYTTYEQLMYNGWTYNVSLDCWIGTSIGSYEIYSISSSSLAVLGAAQGSHVVYSKVTEENVDENNENNGYVEYQYYVPASLQNPSENPYLPPFPPEKDISDITNKLHKQITFDKSGTKLQEVTSDYTFTSPEIPTYEVKGLSIKEKRRRIRTGNVCSPPFYNASQSYFYNYSFYELETSWIKMNSVTTVNYDENGQNPVTNITNYFYDSTVHLQPTRTETSASDGNTVFTQTYYPDDIVNTASLGSNDLLNPDELDAIEELKVSGQHRIAEPVQIETTINGNLTRQRTNYKNWTDTGLILPEIVQTGKGTSPLQDRTSFTSYDDKGNIQEINRIDGPPISYLWGYNKTFPIAKVENASYNDLAQALGVTVTQLKLLDEDDLSQINGLRSSLPETMVSTYTYDPLVGIRTMTDPKGYITRYSYDNFNRLKEVRDQDNNLLTDYQYHYKN